MKQQETFAEGLVSRPEFVDSYNLGRAISLIQALVRLPQDDVTRTLAKEFLAEMEREP